MCLSLCLIACESNNYNNNNESERRKEGIGVTNQNEISPNDAALAIGKYIIEREFPERVSEDTVFAVYEAVEDHPGSQLTFVVEAVFQPNLDIDRITRRYIFDNADVRIVMQWSIHGLTFEYRTIRPDEIE